MRDTDTAELYVHATPEQVARVLPPRTVACGATFTVAGSWHTAPWGPTVEVWRREGRWERGRAHGRATVDLVAAGAERTLVLVTITSDRRGSRGRRDLRTAQALAVQLRDLAERQAAAVVAAHPVARSAAVAAPTAAASPALPSTAAVGYSGP